jgi:hypothetical protein
MHRWTERYKITRTINGYIIEIEHLVTKKLSEVHAFRHQFYIDDQLNVSIHVQEQIQHDEWEGFYGRSTTFSPKDALNASLF